MDLPDLEFLDFEWDESRARANILKHWVAFDRAINAFNDPKRLILTDVSHSNAEKRYFCIGLVENDILTVRFTMRGQKIRIIGAGKWRKGRRLYERR